MLFHSKKSFLLLSVWPGTEYTWALIWNKSLLSCFKSYRGIPYSHTGRVDRMMNTFIKVNITPTCKRWFIGKVYAFPFQKSLPSPFSLVRNRIYLALVWKKSLPVCFESCQGILYSHTGRVDSNVNTLVMVIINLYVRDSLEDKKSMLINFILLKEK